MQYKQCYIFNILTGIIMSKFTCTNCGNFKEFFPKYSLKYLRGLVECPCCNQPLVLEHSFINILPMIPLFIFFAAMAIFEPPSPLIGVIVAIGVFISSLEISNRVTRYRSLK
jgi:hypothetical protein